MQHIVTVLTLLVFFPVVIRAIRSFMSSNDLQDDQFEIFTPNVNAMKMDKGSVSVMVKSKTYSFHLVLEMNKYLISPDFVSMSYDSYGEEIIHKGHENCFYQGSVVGHRKWTLAMSTCDGLRGYFGDLSNAKQLYYVEPLSEGINLLQQPHVIYLATELKEQVGVCGVSDQPDRSLTHMQRSHGSHGSLRNHIFVDLLRNQAENGFLVTEVFVVNDNSMVLKYGSIENALMRVIEIFNIVDNIYKAINIRIVLVGTMSWNNGNQINSVTDSSVYLDNFRDFKPQIKTNHDIAILFSGMDNWDDGVGGRANLGAMCGPKAVAVMRDHHPNAAAVAKSTAHEIGHSFGMKHDTVNNCTCNDDKGCIMWTGATNHWDKSNPPTKFSNCSLKDLETGLAVKNLGVCLTNDPTSIIGKSVCGNGILEPNEVCDCGTKQECKNPCCNAETCTLADGAQCLNSESCCIQCRYSPYGTVCRNALGQCDIAEHCTGTSAQCPADQYLMDGTPCNSGYCYKGMCPTIENQCKFFYGPDSGKGADSCYQTYNVLGTNYGNCGIKDGILQSCAKGDIMCGSLHCLTSGTKHPMHIDSNLGRRIQYGPYGKANEKCKTFIYTPYSGTSSRDIWLVEDGTKCGEDKICLGAKCVPVKNLNVGQCPVGSNDLVCSGNGLCSNTAACACNIGYGGRTCHAMAFSKNSFSHLHDNIEV